MRGSLKDMSYWGKGRRLEDTRKERATAMDGVARFTDN